MGNDVRCNRSMRTDRAGGPRRASVALAAVVPLAMLVSLPAMPAAAQEAVGQPARDAARSVDLRAVLVAVKTRPLADARSGRDDVAPALGSDQLALVDALLLAREGEGEAAEKALRDLLTEDPSRRVVRFELAQLLIRRERYTAARFQLDLLTASEPDPAVRRVYAALDRRISELRPWDVDVSFGVAPRTNANRGSTEEDLGGGYAITSRATSGVGLTYGASVSRRFAITPTIDMYARGFVSGVEYEDRDLAANTVGLGTFARLNGEGGGRVDVGVDLARQYADGNLLDGVASATLVTPYLSFHRPVGRRFAIGGSQRLTRVDYAPDGIDDGWRGTTTARLSFAPQAGRTFSVSGAYGFDRSGLDYQQYDSVEIGASAYAELPLGLSASLGGAVGARDFRAPFPTLGTKEREDTYARASLDLTKRDWAVRGFAPRVGVSYEINDSNVPLYKFDDIGFSAGVSRSF